MINSTVYVGQWLYNRPDFKPDKDGNVALISKGCFGPVEVYEWGVNAKGQAYERYEWLENEFFAYENYCVTIEWQQMHRQIQEVISVFRNSGLSDWAKLYETILEKMKR